MMKEKKETEGMTRRAFLKGTATGVGVAAAAGSGVLGVQVADAEPTPVEDLVQAVPNISPSEIKDIVTADIVVVGAGMSGFCASLSAAEAGSKVITIEKGSKYTTRGFDNGCVNSSVHKEAGVKLDRDEIIEECMKTANYRIDCRLVNLWADNSGAAVDWLVKRIASKGQPAKLSEPEAYSWGPYKHFPTAVSFPDKNGQVFGGNARMMPLFEQLVKEARVDIRYSHPAVQLVRTKNGRVTGVIAKAPQGYVQFNGKKAVVLCSGGYDCSPEMMKKYLRPSDLRIRLFESPNKISTGDGHNMGLAIGADIDEPPHCLMVGSGVLTNNENFYVVSFGPYLRVDKFGSRYVNEYSDYCRQANATQMLPGHFNWAILDERWKKSPEMFGPQMEKLVAKYVEEGVMVQANSLEELAKAMKVNPDVFKATVDRYNDLAKTGRDLDFHKDPKQLFPVDQPPYLAVNTGNFSLVTVSGLKINTQLQILDKEGNPIPGLYGAGNVTGGFFGDTYPRNVGGISHGRAITFGRLAALNAHKEKV
jgi:fumarate reductase flavoprotein subunit